MTRFVEPTIASTEDLGQFCWDVGRVIEPFSGLGQDVMHSFDAQIVHPEPAADLKEVVC